MQNDWKKKIIGHSLMILGICLPLYAFGMMTYGKFDVTGAYQSFKETGSTVTEEKIRLIQEYNHKIDTESYGGVDPFANREYDSFYELTKDDPEQIVAYMKIPALDFLEPVRLGASEAHLAQGVAHIDGTSLPYGGNGNRSVLAAHRLYYTKTMLLHIEELKIGDAIYIDNGIEVLKYVVDHTELIDPSEWQKLKVIPNEDILTLLTCDPIPTYENRLLVNAKRELPKSAEVAIENLSEISTESVSAISKYSSLAIYGATGLLSILLLWRIIALIRYVFTKDSETKGL